MCREFGRRICFETDDKTLAEHIYVHIINQSYLFIARYDTRYRSYDKENWKVDCETAVTVLPAKSHSDVMFCLQSYKGFIIDRSPCSNPINRIGLIQKCSIDSR